MSGVNAHPTAGEEGVSIVHWWEAGDGGDAFEAMIEGFRDRHPGVAVNPRSSDNLGMEVKSRILQENPPDVWFEWPGKNLAPYAKADVLADLAETWEAGGMERHYLDGPKGVSQFDGAYRAVPTDIHRINNLFYLTEPVEAAGVDPGGVDSPREFVEVLEQVQAETDGVGLIQPMKNPWTVLQIWASVLLGEHGADTYEAVLDGAGSRNQRVIADALDIVAAYRRFTADDSLFLDLTTANGRFADGESAFFYQGDWAAEVYEQADGFEYRRDWDHVPFPGTDGLYAMNMDAAMASPDARDPEAVATFLEYCGSPDAQRRLNRRKGSIPPRTDVSLDEFTPFLQDQQRAFKRSSRQPPSIAHGLGVRPDQLIELKTVISDFVGSWDHEAVAAEMAAAFDSEN